MDYLELLENSFEREKEHECAPDTRFEFLAEQVFKFTTYDSGMSDLFGRKAVEVCVAISNRQTFDYIKDAENYQWFLVMCNMPFFVDKLEWGTSIRGAWWDLVGSEKFEVDSCGLWDGYEQILEPLEFDKPQWEAFTAAMASFAAVADET